MRILLISFFMVALVSMVSCIHDPIAPLEHDPEEINLRWNSSYPSEKQEDALTGLLWCLSHLGAKNTNQITSGIEVENNTIKMNLSTLGFSTNAKYSLHKLHQAIFNSPEYIQYQSIDLGRYITLLIGSSNHYYRITGVPETLSQQLANYSLATETGFVNNSSISNYHRTIKFSNQQGLNQYFLSTEIDSVTGDILEFETMELMPNGQFKYAIFNSDSQRVSAPDKIGANAGKPAKCMWCHESTINPLFKTQKDYTGFLTFQKLQDTLFYFKDELTNRQSFITNGVDFSKKQQHTQMELQYIMFKFPSPVRLANEWKMTVAEVEDVLANHSQFTNSEFPFLPGGYIRNDIEKYAPAIGLLTPDRVRELSVNEVNYIE